MRPSCPSSGEELLKEEESLLQAKIACLQQLIAELLLKNQQLREALATFQWAKVNSSDRHTSPCTSR
jgi:hypothetical protein